VTRRISKAGNAYSEGSHATLSGYPNVCAAGCGRPLRISSPDGEALHFETVKGVRYSWHVSCRRSGPQPPEAIAA
jgi:hypothetical protein